MEAPSLGLTMSPFYQEPGLFRTQVFSSTKKPPFGPLLPSYGYDGPEFQKMSVDVTSLQGGGYYEQGVGVLDEGPLQPQVYADSVGLFELSGTCGSYEDNPRSFRSPLPVLGRGLSRPGLPEVS